jgi:hypothetical protein
VKKIGPERTIRYVGAFEDHVTETVQIKHITAGPLRVATKVIGGINAGTYPSTSSGQAGEPECPDWFLRAGGAKTKLARQRILGPGLPNGLIQGMRDGRWPLRCGSCSIVRNPGGTSSWDGRCSFPANPIGVP